MQLKICKTCKRPFPANKEFCQKCPPPYNPDSYANLGCLLLSTAKNWSADIPVREC